MSLISTIFWSGILGAFSFQFGKVHALYTDQVFQLILFFLIKWAFSLTILIAVEFSCYLHHSLINLVCYSILYFFSSEVSLYVWGQTSSFYLDFSGDAFFDSVYSTRRSKLCFVGLFLIVDILFQNFSNESSFLSSSKSSIDDSL